MVLCTKLRFEIRWWRGESRKSSGEQEDIFDL